MTARNRPLALVTGASAGIGATFARALAARGYDLILVARRRERLEELARELEARHGACVETLPADLAGDAGLRQVEERIASAAPDLLVNNAGFGTRGRFWEAPLETQDRMHRLHVIATVRLTHAALAVMMPRGTGAIINVSSVAGFAASPGNVSYCATKHWINAFTEGLYLELKSAGSQVKVQALCPGFTYSEFHDVMGRDRSVIPQAWWLQPEYVVNASLEGLERDELFVIPSFRYRMLALVIRILPDGLRRRLTLVYARRRKLE
ncbi:MAG: SDR family NAD(P)-dependent oxidoreductase [Rhodospirillales bacterium]